MTIPPALSFVRSAKSLSGLPWIAALVLTSMAGLQGQSSSVWKAGTGDWNTASNWDGGVPTSNSGVFISNGGTARLTTANGIGDFLWLLDGAGEISGNGYLTINGNSNWNILGSGGSGTTLSISGPAAGASISSTQPDALRVGYNGNGFVNLSDGGTLTLQGGNGRIALGYFTGRQGTLNIGTGGAAGILYASTVTTNLGSGTVNFNHTDADYFFTKDGTSGGVGVIIANANSVFHLGTGKTTLTAANTYTGGTTISAGTLALAGAGSLLSTGGVNISTGATFDIAGITASTTTIGDLTGAGGVTLGSKILKFGTSNDAIFAGAISGTGGIEKLGAGRATLTGANTYTGTTAVREGVLAFNAGSIVSGNLDINGGELLSLGTATLSGTQRISGTVSAATGQTLTLRGASNTYGTLITIGSAGNEGTVVLDYSSYPGGGYYALTVAAGTAKGINNLAYDIIVAGGATLDAGIAIIRPYTLSGTGSVIGSAGRVNVYYGEFAGTISGGVGVGTGDHAVETGLLILSGENTYTGGTYVTGGDLQIGNGGTTGSIVGNVTTYADYYGDRKSLIFNRSNDLTYNGIVAGVGSLFKQGAGVLTLTGASTYAAGTGIQSGTLALSGGGSLLSTGAVDVSSGATFDIAGITAAATTIGDLTGAGGVTLGNKTMNFGTSADNTFSGVISGTGGLIKNGAGTATFTGVNTYRGGTTVKNGTLALGTGGEINHDAAQFVIGEASGDEGTLTINGGEVTSGAVTLGNVAGSSGSVTVANGSWDTGTTSLTIGKGGTGNLQANAGSEVYADGGIVVGSEIGSEGTLGINGGWVSALGGNIEIGRNGTGTGTLESGSLVGTGGVVLGVGADGDGTFVQNGGNVSVAAVVIGDAGTGKMTLNGGSFNFYTFTTSTVGRTGSGELIMDGGRMSVYALRVGESGTGTLTINADGLSVFNNMQLGVNAGSQGTIALNAGALITQRISRGSGAGTIDFNGGTLQADDSEANFLTGFQAGDVTINVGGGTIDTDEFAIGIAAAIDGTGGLTKKGTGTLTFTGSNTFGGGTSIQAGVLVLSGGGSLLSTGGVNISTGAAFEIAGLTAGSTTIGDLTGSGAVTLGSKILNFGAGTDAIFSGVISGTGGLVKAGSGMATLAGANAYSGGTTINAGTVRATTSASALGTGGLTLNGGNLGLANDTGLNFGRNTLIQQNGTITSDRLTAGAGVAHTLGTLSIGGQALSVGRGANVTSGTAGLTFGATTLTTAATFATAAGTTLTLGALSGDYEFTKLGAGTMVLAAAAARNGALTTLDGGMLRLENANSLGSGGGYFHSYSGSLELAGDVATTFNIGSYYQLVYGSTIIADRLTDGTGVTHTINTQFSMTGSRGLTIRKGAHVTDGTAGVTFNASQINAFSGSIDTGADTNLTLAWLSGSGELYKSGAGTLTLSGASSYAGDIFVGGGSLVVNGSNSGAGTVTARSGATLAGTGSIGGTVKIEDGGFLSPGNGPGTLTIGALDLEDGSIVNFELATPGVAGGPTNDLVAVTDDLDLDGIFNLSFAPNPSTSVPNTYTLMTYGGTLTGGAASVVFGSGPVGFNLSLTAGAGVVTLETNYNGVQYWDGPNMSPQGVAKGSGGNGTWNAANTNWTNQNGNLNNAWSDLTAIFMGTAGTVNVADAVAVTAMQFGTSGYRLNGPGSIGITATNTSFLVATGVTATIETEITGSGGIAKTEAGNLILAGENTYTGGTNLVNGTLTIANNDALGTGILTFNGGTVATDGGFYSVDNDIVLNSNATFVIPDDGSGPGTLELQGDIALGTATRTITLVGEGGTWCSGGVISGAGGLTFQTAEVDGFSVMYCGLASNTYTGLTTVGDKVAMILGTTGVAIAGDLKIDAGGFVGVELEGQFGATSQVTVDGELNLFFADTQRIHDLQGSGKITGPVGDVATLTVEEGNFSGTIAELPDGGPLLSLVKDTVGTLRLSGANTYGGGTTIDAGTLQTNNASALGGGAVNLNAGGTLAMAAPLTIASMTWDGGTIMMNAGEQLTITTTLVMTDAGFVDVAGVLANTKYTLATYLTAGSSIMGITANSLAGLVGVITIDENMMTGRSSIILEYVGSSTGSMISNTAPQYTPTNANFVVSGAVTTSDEVNTVNSLTFDAESILTIFNRLIVTSGNLIVGSGTATIDGTGVLVAPNGLTKLGEGLLNVLNDIIVNGNASIAAGQLAVNGSMTVNDLFVQAGAWLKGNGVIVGNVFNSGTVAPGNSPGTLTITGNFTQASAGTLQEEIASLTNFDRLIIGGTANLGGTLAVVPFGGFELEFGQQFQGIVQAGEINGTFDNITAPDGFRGRVLEDDGILTLVIAPESYTQVAKNQNQHNVAKALDGFIGASGDKDVVSTALDLQTAEQYPAAFDAISPGFFSSLPQISLEQITAQNQFIAQRLNAVRLGVAGFNAQGIEMPLANDRDGKSVMDAKDAKTVITPANATKWALWVQGNGIFGRMSLTNLPTNRFASGGFLGGADYRWSENFSTGIYAGYQGTYSKYSNGSSSTINSTLFGLYATYQQGGFYSDAIVGGAYNNYSNRRSIEFSTVDRTGRSDVDGGQLTAYLDAGYDWQVGKFTFGPLASLQYTYTGLGGFTESGADSLDLAVDGYNANSIRTNLGGRIAYTWNVTDKIVVTPEVRMFWQHEYLNDQQTMSASLDGGAGPSFGYTPSSTGQDSVFAGAGVSAQFGPNWNGYVFYNADFGRQDYVGQMISTGLNWKF